MAESYQTASKSNGGLSPRNNLALTAACQTKAAAGQKGEGPYRYRLWTVALYEISKYQKYKGLIIREEDFQRALREIPEAGIKCVQFQADAVKALLHTTEVL